MRGIDMTSGSTIKKIIRVAVPVLLTNVVNMAYTLTDMFWLGQFNQNALSAVGAIGLFMWLGVGFSYLGKVGTEILVSQSYGKKDLSLVNKYATNGLFLSIILALIYSIFSFAFKHDIINYFDFDNMETKQFAYDYLNVSIFSVFVLILTQQFISIYNGTGNTKIIFYFVMIALILNVTIDPILVIKYQLAAKGAAYATLFALLVLLMMFILHSKIKSDVLKNAFKNYSLKKIYKMISLGFFPMIQQMIFAVVFIVMSSYVTKFGEDNLAVSRIGSQVEALTWIIGGAALTAVTVHTGQNFKIHQYKRIAKGVGFVMGIMILYSFVIVGLFIAFGEQMFLVILPKEPNTALLGATYLLINSISQPFMMIEFVSSGYFNGQEKTKIPAIASTVGNILRIPLMYYFADLYGVNGIWIAMCVSAVCRGLFLFFAMVISIAIHKEYKFKHFLGYN